MLHIYLSLLSLRVFFIHIRALNTPSGLLQGLILIQQKLFCFLLYEPWLISQMHDFDLTPLFLFIPIDAVHI